LQAVDAAGLTEAQGRRASFDKGADALASEAANLGQRRETVRWVTLAGRRRAFSIQAQPLEGGGVGVWADDVTETEELKEQLKRSDAAHDDTLNHIADAVAIFSHDKRLTFHNTAFAEMWGLEPAWLAERPGHGEILDRLRQRRRLPETADYAKWKAAELDRYGALRATPDALWSLPDGRTLRVVRQPHPMGGILLLCSVITGETRRKGRCVGLLQVPRGTRGRLDAAAGVLRSDGGRRLHNEAFDRVWHGTAQQRGAAGGCEGVVERCVPRLPDMQFWRE